MLRIRRPMTRHWPLAHPVPWVVPASGLRGILGGHVQVSAAIAGGGPAGPVGPIPGTDKGYLGMDPSDPKTWVRPYRPVPGMIARLNQDGAHPNRAQTGP